MQMIDVFQSLKNLFNNDKDSRKRSTEPPAYPGLVKRKNQNSQINDYSNNSNFDKIKMQRMPEQLKPSYAECEFSDSDNGLDDVFSFSKAISSNHRNVLNQNSYCGPSSSALISNSNNKFIPTLSKENYSKNPIVRHIPIQYEHKVSKGPPPLLPVKKTDVLAATSYPPVYKFLPKKVKNNDSDENRTQRFQSYSKDKNLVTPINTSSSKCSNGNSILKSFNLQSRVGYMKLLECLAPSLYTSKQTEQNDEYDYGTSSKYVDLSRNEKRRSRHFVDNIIEIIELNDENDEEKTVKQQYTPRELIDLSYDDDIQIITSLENGFPKSPTSSSPPSERPLPKVEPINTLKQQFDLKPKLQENWVQDFKEKYKTKNLQIKQKIREQKEYAKKISEEIAKQEEKVLRERMNNILIQADPVIYDLIEEEEEEFPEFSETDVKLIEKAIRGGPNTEVLVSKFNINITRKDIRTLVGTSWLNDEIINFYMNLLMQRSEDNPELPKVYAMNTFFIPRLMQSDHIGVKRWTRKVDIFSYDIIPVPVHVGGVHWCMAIIHLRNKTITYYDSMGHTNYAVIDMLDKYLRDESFDKRKIPFDTSDFIKICAGNLPKQLNGSDCGVFSCMFAEYITRNKDITFDQQDMQYFRQKMILEIMKGKLL